MSNLKRSTKRLLQASFDHKGASKFIRTRRANLLRSAKSMSPDKGKSLRRGLAAAVAKDIRRTRQVMRSH